MGIGDRSAFPEHLDTQEEVDAAFPDDSQYKGFFGNLFKRWEKATKHWGAFGPRSPKGLAFCHLPPFIFTRKWREIPAILWAEKMDGYWRFESDGKEDKWSSIDDPNDFLKTNPDYYLSRNQMWCRRHKAILWPLFYSFHAYEHSKDIIPVGERGDRDGKIWLFYIGAKRDADRIFWWIAAYLGRNFK